MIKKCVLQSGSITIDQSRRLKILDCTDNKNFCLLPEDYINNKVSILLYDFARPQIDENNISRIFENIDKAFNILKNDAIFGIKGIEIFALQTFSLLVNESWFFEKLLVEQIVEDHNENYHLFIGIDSFFPLKKINSVKFVLSIFKCFGYLALKFFKSQTKKERVHLPKNSGMIFYEIPFQNQVENRSYFFEDSDLFNKFRARGNYRLLFDDIGYANTYVGNPVFKISMASLLKGKYFLFCIIKYSKIILTFCILKNKLLNSIAESLRADICSTGTISNLLYYYAFYSLVEQVGQNESNVKLVLPFEGKPLEKMALLAKNNFTSSRFDIILNSIFPLAPKHIAFDNRNGFWRTLKRYPSIRTVRQTNIPLLRQFGWKTVKFDGVEFLGQIYSNAFNSKLNGKRLLICLTMSEKCNLVLFDTLAPVFKELSERFDVRVRPHPFLPPDWKQPLIKLSDSWKACQESCLDVALSDSQILLFGDNSVGYHSLKYPIFRIFVRDTLFYSGNRIGTFTDCFVEHNSGLDFVMNCTERSLSQNHGSETHD